MTVIAVVSPHLDDAALSCWSVLDAPGDRLVLNVFTGPPDPSRERPWDALTRAQDGAQRMQARIAEDRAALAHAGCTPTNLGLSPPASPEAAARLREVLADALPAGSDVYLPAAIGGHPAHVLVRDVGLEVAGRPGRTYLYADYPYAVRYGWPAWVTGAEPDPYLAPEADWEQALDSARLPGALEADVRALDDAMVERKLAALHEYRTQWGAFSGGPLRIVEHPAVRGYEVAWWLRN